MTVFTRPVKPKDTQISRMETSLTMMSSLFRRYGQVAVAGEKSVFFKDMAASTLTTIQYKTTHTRLYVQHKLDFMGLKQKRDHKVSWVLKWNDLGRAVGGGEYD